MLGDCWSGIYRHSVEVGILGQLIVEVVIWLSRSTSSLITPRFIIFTTYYCIALKSMIYLGMVSVPDDDILPSGNIILWDFVLPLSTSTKIEYLVV